MTATPGMAVIGAKEPRLCRGWRFLLLLAMPLALSQEVSAADPVPAPAATQVPLPDVTAAVAPPVVGYDLDTLKALALKDNPDLAAAMDRVRAATARILEAQAAYYPTLDYAVAASRSRDLASNGSEERTSSRYQHGPSAAWVVFDGFLRQFDTQRLRSLAVGQESLGQDVRRVLVNSVASAYYLAMQASDRRRIARDAAEISRSLLEICRRQLVAGVAMDVDCMNFQVRLNNAELDSANADLGFSSAVAALRELLGAHAPPGETYRFPTEDPAIEADLLDTGNALAMALGSRPDLRAAAHRVDAAQAVVKGNKAAFWPTLAVNGEIRYEDPAAFSVDDDSLNWLVGASLSWALFDGGKRSSRVQTAEAEVDAALHDLEALRRTVGREIEETQGAVRILLRSLGLYRDTVALSRQILKLTRQRYEMGLESVARLNQALNDVTDVERNHSDTRAALAMAIENLDAATGRSLGASP